MLRSDQDKLKSLMPFNPAQAGVFWYNIGWGGVPSLSVVQLPPNLAWWYYGIKSLNGIKSQIENDVTMTPMTSSLLC